MIGVCIDTNVIYHCSTRAFWKNRPMNRKFDQCESQRRTFHFPMLETGDFFGINTDLRIDLK